MSAMDYGVVIFKNGMRYKGDELFANIDGFEDGYFFRIPIIARTYNSQKVWHENKIDVKEIANGVYRSRVYKDGDVYNVISGYGIDNDKSIWDRVKYAYHNKRDVRIIDRMLNKYDWR